MRKYTPILVIVTVSLLLILTLTTAAARPADSGVDLNPGQGQTGYEGSQVCKTCHGETHTTLQNTLHPWKVRPKAEANIVGNWPVEWDGETYTLDQVDWVIGAHPKWKQRYIDIDDQGVWNILPFQWNIETQEFVAYSHAGDYRDGCAGCHTTGYDVTTKTWTEPGVWCEACHGPGKEHVEGGFANPPGERKIYAKPDAEVCGSCHTRGKTKDGMYSWPEGYVPGGDVHLEDIYDVTTDPSKWWFDNPADPNDPYHAKSHHQQYPEWKASRHSIAVDEIKSSDHGSEACLACHSQDYRDDPENVTVESAEFSVTCQTCHLNHEEGDIGSQLVKDPYELCIECHNGHLPESGKFEPGSTIHHPMMEMFEGIGFPAIEDIPSRHFLEDAGASCNNCHMPKTAKSALPGDITSHRFAVVMPEDAKDGEQDSCVSCHSEEAVGKEWLQTVIDQRQTDVQAELARIQAWLDAHADQSDSDAYKTAYTGHSMVAAEGSSGIHNYAYAKAVLGVAKAAIGSPEVLEAYKVRTPPVLDGDASDAAWDRAKVLALPSLDLTMKAVFTDDDLYVLVLWNDSTASFTRSGSWSWDGDAWVKSAGQSEDRVAIMWDMETPNWAGEGCGTKCHPGHNEPGTEDDAWLENGKADMWHMKAARSLGAISASQEGAVTVDPATHEVTAGAVHFNGYTDDKWIGPYSADNAPDGGRYGDPGGGGYSHNRNAEKTAPMYIETNPTDYMDAMILRQSEIDGGEAVELATLSEAQRDAAWAKYAAVNAVVPERVIAGPGGSRADVMQSATWQDGVWTLEYKRALDTGHPDEDVIFDDLSQQYGFGVATMDNAGGEEHNAVGLKLDLVFNSFTELNYLPMFLH